MKHLGYVEGVNMIVDQYSAEGRFDRYPEIVHEIVATRPEVILTMGPPPTVKLFQSETRTIPIVVWTGDPVTNGIISSLARPGGNVTGLSSYAGSNVGTKRLQLLLEACR
jgi:putative ABC transport system substrate-binding protein